MNTRVRKKGSVFTQKYPIMPSSSYRLRPLKENHKLFLTFTEVQSYLGVKSRKTILKYIKSGNLPAFKLGGTRWRILQTDVDDFLNNHRTPDRLTTHLVEVKT